MLGTSQFSHEFFVEQRQPIYSCYAGRIFLKGIRHMIAQQLRACQINSQETLAQLIEHIRVHIMPVLIDAKSCHTARPFQRRGHALDEIDIGLCPEFSEVVLV